jgi:hypothetical protein
MVPINGQKVTTGDPEAKRIYTVRAKAILRVIKLKKRMRFDVSQSVAFLMDPKADII